MAMGTSGVVSVTQHPKGWRARVRYRDWDGNLRELTRYARTRVAAKSALQDALDEALAAASLDAPITSATTMAELARAWIRELPHMKLADSSRRAYEVLAKKYVTGETEKLTITPLREMPIGMVTPAKINQALRRIGEVGGPGSAKSMHSVYRGMFELALEHEALPTNPARQATFRAEAPSPRKLGKDPRRAFTDEELADVLNKLAEDRRANDLLIVTLVRILAGTGVRIGEAIALSWGDLDLAAGTLHVPGTKTSSSDRTIHLPPWLIAALEARQGFLGHPPADSPICPSPLGKRRDSSNTIRAVTGFLERAGYPWASSHTFRKTVATRLDRAGLSPREIANHLGHSNPAMTLSAYMDRRSATEQVAAIL